MQRRGKSGRPAKRRASRAKIRKAAIAPASADQSADQFDRLKRERDEALEQLAATSEVLSVISRSAGELQSVFETILANATRICAAKFGTLYLRDGDSFRAAAFHNAPPAFIEARKDRLIQPDPGAPLAKPRPPGRWRKCSTAPSAKRTGGAIPLSSRAQISGVIARSFPCR